MNLPLASRLSLTGMLGLAALTATHWLRAHGIPSGPVLSFVIGVTPNAAAAVAMPLILASILPSASAPNGQRAFLGILAFTTAGLCVWEFVQAFNRHFVFDVYDLTATGVGSALAYRAYLLLKR
jgi:hypothetical protein